MYRIELTPGEETVFRNIEELAIGVRNGLVTSRARIYHSASQKWLPIEFHPHYKQALSLPASRPGASSATPPERTGTLSFAVPRTSAAEAPAASPVVAAPVVAAPVEPAAIFAPPAAARPAASVVSRHTTAATLDAVASFVVEEPAAPPAPLPPVMASPVLHLPTISYPMISREGSPVGPGKRATSGRRPFRLVILVAGLSLGAYAVMSAYSPSRGDAEPVPAVADAPAMPPEVSEPAFSDPAPSSAGEDPTSDVASVVPPPRPVSPPPAARAPLTMTQPASSGFAPALEPRAIVSTSSAPAPGPVKVAGSARDSSIAPAPLAVDMSVPVLTGAELEVPEQRFQGDSGMKRILRAVNGGKDVPQRR